MRKEDHRRSRARMFSSGRRALSSPTPATARTAGAKRSVSTTGGKRARGAAAGAAAALYLTRSCVFLGVVGVVDVVRADDLLNIAVAGAFVFSAEQLTVLNEEVLVEEGVFTDYTDEDGLWVIAKGDDDEPVGKEVWTSGMVSGMFWYQYEATGDEAMKTAGEFYNKGLEGVELLDDNDTGFQVLNSFGLAYRLTDSETDREDYLSRVLQGAATLHDNRWDSNIPAYWSWANPSDRPEWDRAVNVDMIMNMEILLWAHVNGGDDHDADVESHADLTWLHLVRDDNSTNHVADFDIETGEFVETGTYQGYADDSTWTRGQAWAVYGYAMVYRYLEKPRFLEMCLGVLEYFDANLPADYVPPADFDAPESATQNGKDSSATAIVSSALIELFLITEDPVYLVQAQTYLSALLSPDYYLPEADDGYQSILRRATAAWDEPEVGATFGDYFLLEAMVRYQKLAPSILLYEEAEMEVVADVSEERRRRLANTPDRGEEEDASARRLQTLSGGEFCALSVSGGVVSFADPDCVPVAPDFSELNIETANTPAPTTGSSSTSDARGEVDVTPAPSSSSPSPEAGGTPAPSATTAPAPSSSSSGASLEFGSLELDNDVDLSYLNATAPVIVWLSVDLGNTDSTPVSLSLENADGDVLETVITAPDGGWEAGSNKLVFEAEFVGTFVPAAWTSVVSVVLGFEADATAASGATTGVTVDWLIVTNELSL